MNASKTWKNIRRFAKGEAVVRQGEINESTLRRLIEKDNPTILEIGCNDGTHTKWFLDIFPNAKIFCFEPDPRAYRRFIESVNADQIQLFNMAISDTDGEIDFFMSSGTPPSDAAKSLAQDWDLSGSIKKPKLHLEKHPWCNFDNTIKVKTMKLDSWAAENKVNAVDFIWADVQGSERELISGGKYALEKTRYFYTEYSEKELYEGQINFRQLTDLLPGFRVAKRYRYDVLLENKSLKL